MRLYLAGAENNDYYEQTKDICQDFLVSYFYIRNKKTNCLSGSKNVFLDSGAFSAMHSGADIDIQAYCEFIKEHGHRFEKVAQLDCIGDWRGTSKNLDYMRGQGLDPIPVFHTNEPFEWLDELLKNDYLCLGVTGSKLRQPQIIAWLVEVFKRREKINPSCKMHGFALTSAKIMKYFDWDTCDSTTWLVGVKFNNALNKDLLQLKKNKHQIKKSDILRHNANMMLEYVRQINKLKGKAVVVGNQPL